MNVHDSERIAGVLEADGYIPFSGEGIPDLIVFNTCAVRENAANRLYGTLGLLRPLKEENPHLQFAVGGLSLIHISEPTRRLRGSRMPSSA